MYLSWRGIFNFIKCIKINYAHICENICRQVGRYVHICVFVWFASIPLVYTGISHSDLASYNMLLAVQTYTTSSLYSQLWKERRATPNIRRHGKQAFEIISLSLHRAEQDHKTQICVCDHAATDGTARPSQGLLTFSIPQSSLTY